MAETLKNILVLRILHIGFVKNKILFLIPFLNQYGVLRVGGRLKTANMDYETKHPILLSKDHAIVKRIIRTEYVKNLHAGIQTTIYAVWNKFWPISAKVTIRNIKKCVTCFKLKPSRLKCRNAKLIQLNDFLTETQIEWQMIPLDAPHFDGLWEAAIKSTKYHMKRIISNASLNYDEISTIIAEIEAILNSRPISPMSDDPNNVQVLTLGHFLIGQSLNSYF
ncbi:hypothetical protein ALC56_14128 [Trachymyrmex septentrionalis]|uniref:Integrase zinc-binding domain-containing protein n=1 Tax=Trachymyrmex septentrionalis TaxID=34720 RepID=A0A195EUS2_9HYME|nr:hypothetical protein ALC56_14128 [Trachymyrmex septentrionalis]